MTTKRILAIMLSLALVLGMLAGCGGDSGELREPVGSSPAETEAPIPPPSLRRTSRSPSPRRSSTKRMA